MPTNVEIKARIRDWNRTRGMAEALANGSVTILEQEDTFFASPKGRLKLRKFSETQGELIAYQRDDTAGTKSSHYFITQTFEPDVLREVLAHALQILGGVKKQRHLYICDQTRIHLDQVVGLGNFLELEVVMRIGESIPDGENIAHTLMSKLDVRAEDLIAGAYLDLILAKSPSSASGKLE